MEGNMLTDQEQARLQELLEKDSYTPEEEAELASLQDKQDTSEEDEFDAAFAESIGEGPDEDQQPDGDDDQDGDDDPGEQQPQDTDDTTVDWKDKALQFQAEINKLNQKMSSWEGRIKAANERAEKAEKQLQDAKQQTGQGKQAPPVTGDDDADLSAFIKEFPDLYKPIKALAEQLANNIVEKKLEEIQPQLEEVSSAVAQQTTDNHIKRIDEAHPDWRQHHESGKLQAWIDMQPAIHRAEYSRIVKSGSTEEIIEMLDLYKKGSGIKPTKQPARSPELAVTASSAGPPKTVTDKARKDDFDGAWNEAMKGM